MDMRRRGNETIFAVWKNGEYVGEGNATEMAKLTGLTRQSIHAIACKSYQAINKKWYAERVVGEHDIFAPLNRVNYDRLHGLMEQTGTENKDIAEVLSFTTENTKYKVQGRVRFRYSELKELEDLFFLEEGELLVHND